MYSLIQTKYKTKVQFTYKNDIRYIIFNNISFRKCHWHKFFIQNTENNLPAGTDSSPEPSGSESESEGGVGREAGTSMQASRGSSVTPTPTQTDTDTGYTLSLTVYTVHCTERRNTGLALAAQVASVL